VVYGLELDQLALEGTYPAESGPLVIASLSRPWIRNGHQAHLGVQNASDRLRFISSVTAHA
jgi:hypothetical protein